MLLAIRLPPIPMEPRVEQDLFRTRQDGVSDIDSSYRISIEPCQHFSGTNEVMLAMGVDTRFEEPLWPRQRQSAIDTHGNHYH